MFAIFNFEVSVKCLTKCACGVIKCRVAGRGEVALDVIGAAT